MSIAVRADCRWEDLSDAEQAAFGEITLAMIKAGQRAYTEHTALQTYAVSDLVAEIYRAMQAATR